MSDEHTPSGGSQPYDVKGSPRSPSPGMARPQVVHVSGRPTTFGRVLGIVGGLFLFGLVFLLGLVLGAVMMSVPPPKVMAESYRPGGYDKVAIIPVKGVILGEQASFVRHCVDHVLNDSSYQAVVLRVDSPGGGVTASDQIWYQINRLKEKNIPVVASYGALAASGGYYVSCHADHILCEETGVTGSIGVIAQIFTFQELANKVGVEPVTLVASGSPDKDVANNVFREWNEQDKQKIRTMLDAAYATFRKRVENGRGGALPDSTTLDAIADGSVFTAGQAVENGLIDGLGYLDDAITKAENLANLRPGEATVQLLRRPPSLFPQPSLVRAALNDNALPSSTLFDADQVRNVINDLSAPRVMYLMR